MHGSWKRTLKEAICSRVQRIQRGGATVGSGKMVNVSSKPFSRR